MGINDLDIDVMGKSDMVYDDSSDFKPIYSIQIHSLNEALFYEFSELVKNGYEPIIVDELIIIGKVVAVMRYL